ncbi:MAG: hypothetical protein [Caudoviricetes sp.]|nr:MAG: hypothetical protein [Caudoviricetes sp.]
MKQVQMDCVLSTVKLCMDHKLEIPAWCYSEVRGLQSDAGAKMVSNALSGDEEATAKYDERMIGIERRWDALMKRRNEPKRKAWQVEVIGDMPNN